MEVEFGECVGEGFPVAVGTFWRARWGGGGWGAVGAAGGACVQGAGGGERGGEGEEEKHFRLGVDEGKGRGSACFRCAGGWALSEDGGGAIWVF